MVKANHLRGERTVSCGCAHEESIGIRLTYVDGTCVEMLRTKTIRKNNTSGVPGAERQKDSWRATICFKGKRHYLGRYQRLEDAVEARKAAETRLHDSFLQEYDRFSAQEEQTDIC